MKAKHFKEMLENVKDDDEIIFSSDEELNCLRRKGEIGYDESLKAFIIYGFDGTEIDIDEELGEEE